MQVSAKLRHLRMSPRKVRLVADVIRGLDVKNAQNQLSFMNKRAAKPVLKLLNSAVANAEHNFKFKKDNLYISELRVDEGAILKRWRARAMGRAAPINKRTSHILIVLSEKKVGEKAISDQGSVIRNKKDKVKKEDKKKIDKDVTVVKSLDEVKEIGKKEEIKAQAEAKKLKGEDYKPEVKDIRREGSDRAKQHLDKVRKKDKGGFLKRMFRRKSI